MNELFLAAIYCALIAGGEAETRQPYSVGYNLHYIRVDCETPTHVIELGLDKRSATDSVHQALFAAQLTGKAPKVVMIDTDGREDQYEYQVRSVAAAAGVDYEVFDKDYLIRWQMTSYLRNYPTPGAGGS
ncbi:hypothetical protein [Vannielia sp.]|uniref:hypothetical protein n=1 Tax=Vannielia sp. TaxID=2813045 RepID=UPI0026290B61|nr:hypothetical protein [Vannielia sp.]MDF1873505.1 hypothetical protein [Vannielia sp.]